MTNFALQFFGKSLKDITENDLIIFFSESRAETDNIEYKSYPKTADWEAGLNKLLKTISSMLNGSGGIVIWGAPLGQKPEGSKEPIFVGDLTPISIKKEQDWFINKISSSISPMPKDIIVSVISTANGSVYLFEVQESQYKPHQFDHIYFIRLDGQTKPAPHYIVQALMREIKFPDIRGVIGVSEGSITDNRLVFKLRVGIFNASQLQNEFDVSFKVLLVGARFANPGIHPIYTYSLRNGLVQTKTRTEPLYYGMPYTANFMVIAEPLATEIKMLLSFGGRQSPAKISEYVLDIRKIYLDNIQQQMNVIKENETFKELQTIDQSLLFFKENNL